MSYFAQNPLVENNGKELLFPLVKIHVFKHVYLHYCFKRCRALIK